MSSSECSQWSEVISVGSIVQRLAPEGNGELCVSCTYGIEFVCGPRSLYAIISSYPKEFTMHSHDGQDNVADDH